jgi:hypothetical protein
VTSFTPQITTIQTRAGPWLLAIAYRLLPATGYPAIGYPAIGYPAIGYPAIGYPAIRVSAIGYLAIRRLPARGEPPAHLSASSSVPLTNYDQF